MIAVERSLPWPVALLVVAVVAAVWLLAPVVSRWWGWRRVDRARRQHPATARTFPYPLPDPYRRNRR